MADVTFPADLGGDGNTYSDDAHPDTGLAAGGHRERFVPALGQALAMAIHAKQRAQEAADSATATGQDAAATAADRVATGEDRTATGQDATATAADRVATGEDRTATGQDATATAADRVATGEDRTATGQDATATAADRVATGQDRTATGQDATATAADRVATGEDRTATGQDAAATAADRLATETARDEIQSVYYGPQASDPIEDPLGNPPAPGDRYFNTTEGVEKVYTGAAWVVNEVSGHLADPDPHPQYAGQPNLIVDGNFHFWFEGTSQTGSGYGSATMWRLSSSGTTKELSRQSFALGQTGVPGSPKHFARLDVSLGDASSDYTNMAHQLEGVSTLAGKIATLSFWAKANAALDMAVEFKQNFGSGGTPSATVEAIGVNKISMTTEWQRYTMVIAFPGISGKSLGTDGNDHLGMTFWFTAGADWDSRTAALGHQTGVFDIAHVKLEEGPVATEGGWRSYAEELSLCKRYFYQLGFDEDDRVAVAQLYASTGNSVMSLPHPVEMRATPTVTINKVYGTHAGFGSSFLFDFIGNSIGLSPRMLSLTLNAASSGHTSGTATVIQLRDLDSFIRADARL